jgi:hypothetical protein
MWAFSGVSLGVDNCVVREYVATKGRLFEQLLSIIELHYLHQRELLFGKTTDMSNNSCNMSYEKSYIVDG